MQYAYGLRETLDEATVLDARDKNISRDALAVNVAFQSVCNVLSNAKPRHVSNIAYLALNDVANARRQGVTTSIVSRKLTAVYNDMYDRNRFYDDASSIFDTGTSFVHECCKAIAGACILNKHNFNYLSNLIDKIKASYDGDTRYYKKGRPQGAKNKPKTTKTTETGNSYDAGNILEGIATEIKDAAQTIKVEQTKAVTVTDNSDLGARVAKVENRLGELITSHNESVNNVTKKFDQQSAFAAHNNQTVTALIASLTKEVEALKNATATRIEIVTPASGEVKDMGLQHKKFPLLMQMVNARKADGSRLNIYVTGPAGTGKSTAAKNVAKALSLDFYTTGALSADHKVLGFHNAHTYVSTCFRDAWERGGIYCLDEVDASNPAAVLALNGALANTICAFPDKMVERHKDCVIIATANTIGNGATAQYSGRSKIDAASLDRFVVLEWPIDEGLEAALSSDPVWLKIVQGVRKGLVTQGINTFMVTPRATEYGESLLRAGMSLQSVKEAVLKKGMTDAQWSAVTKDMH